MSPSTIRVSTFIAAPIERCFLLSTSIDLHLTTTAHTQERAIAGVTHGLISLGQRVTWQGRHFGLMFTHESRIVRYESPHYFQDEMTRGVFHSFAHDHFFESTPEGTLMRDELRFTAPLGILGRIAEAVVLRRHLTRFLLERNAVLQSVAESDRWRLYLS